MISSMAHWLLVLAYLFGLSSVLLSVLGLGRMLLKREYVIWSIRGEPGPAGKLHRLRKLTVTLAKMTALLIIGYAARDLQQFRHTYVLSDVRVIRRDAPDMYHMYSGDQAWEMKLCSDSKVDWDEGSRLKLLVYEDRGVCKSIGDKKLGYLVARDSAGRPIKEER